MLYAKMKSERGKNTLLFLTKFMKSPHVTKFNSLKKVRSCDQNSTK